MPYKNRIFFLICIQFLIQSITCPNSRPEDAKNQPLPAPGVIDQLNKEVFQFLTTAPIYNKYLPPQENHPIQVRISIFLFDFGTINEATMEFSLHLLLRISWFDERLRPWNATIFPGQSMAVLEGGSWHLDRLWTPSLHIPNSKTPNILQDQSQETVLTRIQSDGQILVSKRIILNGVSDQMAFGLFPLDVQKIHFEIESNELSAENMELSWVDVVPFDTNDEFIWNGYDMIKYELKNLQVNYSHTGAFSKVVAVFHLRSHFEQFLLDFYVPIYLCVIISWGSFWINITEAGARVSFGVTVLFTLATAARNARAKMPLIETVNALDIWILVCIFYVFASLMEYTAVNYIFHAEKRAQLKKNKRRKSALAKQLTYAARQHRKHVLRAANSANSLQALPQDGAIDDSMPPDDDELSSKFNSKISSYFSFSSCFGSSSSSYPVNREGRKKGEGSQEIAIEIDAICRMAFPITFAMFNVIYWTVMIVSSKRWTYV